MGVAPGPELRVGVSHHAPMHAGNGKQLDVVAGVPRHQHAIARPPSAPVHLPHSGDANECMGGWSGVRGCWSRVRGGGEEWLGVHWSWTMPGGRCGLQPSARVLAPGTEGASFAAGCSAHFPSLHHLLSSLSTSPQPRTSSRRKARALPLLAAAGRRSRSTPAE